MPGKVTSSFARLRTLVLHCTRLLESRARQQKPSLDTYLTGKNRRYFVACCSIDDFSAGAYRLFELAKNARRVIEGRVGEHWYGTLRATKLDGRVGKGLIHENRPA